MFSIFQFLIPGYAQDCRFIGHELEHDPYSSDPCKRGALVLGVSLKPKFSKWNSLDKSDVIHPRG